MKPRIPITSSEFRYTSAVETDIRKLFAKVRREQREAAAREQSVREEAAKVVRKLPAQGKG